VPQNALIALRRDTAANWTSVDPVLELGEPGYETDTTKIKVGDGSTAWTSLPYLSASVSSIVGITGTLAEFNTALTGADFATGGGTATGTNTGDQTITLTGHVTGSGTGSFATTIPAGTVTLAMQANMPTASVVYRKTAGSGAPETQTLATLKTDLGLTGTNSGDQTSIVGITGTLAEFNTALTGADFATGGGTATGTNTGDQTTITGNAGTATALQTARNINGVAFDGTANITINAVDSTARVPETRTISTTAPLTGGGDLSANRTLAISPATGSDPGSMSASDKTKLDAISGTNTGDQTSIVGITGTLAEFNTALTGADFATGGGTATGTNTGDQTSIVGITGTLAEFNTALTGADFATGGGTATGTNTGDQTITLTGDVTGSGTGSFATTINASFYKAGGTDVALADGGTGASLTDPNADRILFWDDSAGQMTWLTLGTNLSITGTTLDAAGGGGGLSDGDKGDVVVSGSGTVLTVESAAGDFAVAGDLTVSGGDANITSTNPKLRVTDSGDATFWEMNHNDGFSVYTSGANGHYFYTGGSQWFRIHNGSIWVDTGASFNITGDFTANYLAAPTTPSADKIGFAPQRLNASGGRVLPRWKSEDGVVMSMASHQGRNTVVWGQAIGNANTVIAPVGMAALTGVGTATARNVATTSRLTRSKRIGYVSAGTAGSGAGLSNNTTGVTQWTVGGAAGAGFKAIFRFAVSDASLVAGAHSIIGMKNLTASPGVTTNPNTLTNIIACCQTNGSANWHICYGGSAAQTPVDTGIAIANTDLLEFIIYARPDVNNKVTWRLENISTGSVASGELTGTAGTALPANTSFLGPVIWRSNNATASAVGIDISSYYIESDFG
jgi:hypothetical protein